MNYRYQVMTFDVKETEIECDKNYFFWNYKLLSDSDQFILRDAEHVISSFRRTKQWTIENHPELLL
jgi:hypothetical protein